MSEPASSTSSGTPFPVRYLLVLWLMVISAAVYLDRMLAEKQARLQDERASGRITSVELAQRLALARFERDEAMKESSLKYAYVWFQTAAELFSPPESRWVTRSRLQMAAAKELWKKELAAKKIPYQDCMLE